MRFLRLLLFLFVLLAPLQPTASHADTRCTKGEGGACESCCNECLTPDPDRDPDDYMHEPPSPAPCRHLCQGRNSCALDAVHHNWLVNLILQLTNDRVIWSGQQLGNNWTTKLYVWFVQLKFFELHVFNCLSHLLNTFRLEAVYNHSLIITPFPAMLQKIHPQGCIRKSTPRAVSGNPFNRRTHFPESILSLPFSNLQWCRIQQWKESICAAKLIFCQTSAAVFLPGWIRFLTRNYADFWCTITFRQTWSLVQNWKQYWKMTAASRLGGDTFSDTFR